MQIQDKGRPLHDDAHVQDPPAHLPRGQLLRRRHARHVRASRGSPTATRFPVNQTATPVQLDQVLTALQSDTREDLKTLAARVRRRPRGQGRQGLQRVDQVLEARLPRLGDRLRGAARRAGARPLRLHRPRRRRRRRARPQPASRSRTWSRTSASTAGAFARENAEPRGRDRRAAAHAARRPARARALNRSFPGRARASPATCARASRSSGPTIDAALPLARAAARPGLRARAARPDRRPAPDRPGARQPDQRERAAHAAGARRRRAARTRSSCRGATTRSPDPTVPGRPARSTRSRPSRSPGLAGESRSGDANGQWFRVLAAGGTNLVQLGTGMFVTTALPLLGVNPPKPTAPAAATTTCRARRSRRPTCARPRARRPQPRKVDDPAAASGPLQAAPTVAPSTGCASRSRREGLADKLDGHATRTLTRARSRSRRGGRRLSDRDPQARSATSSADRRPGRRSPPASPATSSPTSACASRSSRPSRSSSRPSSRPRRP